MSSGRRSASASGGGLQVILEIGEKLLLILAV
jgi:hypothetical protein